MAAARSMTKTEAAFHTLRAAIEEGRFLPGERLTLARLLEELDMSATPIREAIRLLQAEGLLEHEPHHGVVVAEYSPEKVEEIYRLRVVLEPLATELAVERATEEQIATIRRLHEALATAVEEGGVRTDVAELNAEWHREVYAASGSRYLQEFIARLWTASPVGAIWLTRRAKHSIAHHAAFMAAIERGDAAAAAQCMREHIAFGADSTTEHLRTIKRL
jgi:DNA-binding GntR family transcriptional regulator